MINITFFFLFFFCLSLLQFLAKVMKGHSNRKAVEQLNPDEETPERVSFLFQGRVFPSYQSHFGFKYI